MAFPDTIYDSFDVKDEGVEYGRFGNVTMDELVKLANYHTVRNIQASSDVFGWVDVAKKQAVRKLKDIHDRMPETIQRLKDKGDEVVYVAHVHLRKPSDGKTSWTLTVCSIKGRIPGNDNSYYPVW